MTVRVNKPEFNLREKLTELERPIGLKGSELMRAETTQEARDFIGACRKNLVINGDMRINQRGSGVLTGSTAFPVDRVKSYVGYGNCSVEQYSLSSGDGPPTQRFNHSLRVTSTHGNLTASHSYAQINYRLEHTDLFNSGWDYTGHSSHNNYLTISFWVRSSVNSDFNWMFLSHDGTPQVFRAKLVPCNGGVWKKIIARVPPNPNITLNNSVGNGASLYLFPMAGTVYTSSTSNLDGWETWSGSDKYGIGGDNGIPWGGTSGATFDITGLQIEVGKNATEFEHRSYGEELALCKRYYQRMGDTNTNEIVLGGYSVSGSAIYHTITLPVEMRVVPTLTQVGTFYTVHTGQPVSLSGHVGRKGFGVAHTTTGDGYFLIASSDVRYFVLDAEL